MSLLLILSLGSISPALTVSTPAITTVPVTVAAAIPAMLTGPEIFAKAGPAVYKLETRIKGGNSGRSHGTAFAVHRDGYLITNFHVVADVAAKPEKYDLILKTDGLETRGVIKHIDPVNDIALVKVELPLKDILSVAAQDGLRLGESLFSLGFPKSEELSMAQGNFNGQRMMGFSTVTAASLPLNPGMSGGPCLNTSGEVVAVNRAMMVQAQNISYFSPGAALRRMVAQASVRNERIPASTDWSTQILSEIGRQERWAMDLPANQLPAQQKIGRLTFNLPFANMKCGQDADNSRLSKSEFIHCHNISLALAGPDVQALQIRTVATQDKKPFTSMQAFDALSKSYDEMVKSHKERRRDTASVGPSERCGAHSVRNAHGVNMKVRYCSHPLPEFRGLYATYFKIDVRDGANRDTSIAQSYEGMTMEATGKMVKKFLDGIEVQRGER